VISALIIGLIAGLILGFLLTFYSRAGTYSGNVTPSEAGLVVGSLLGILFLLTVGSGVLAWIVRLVFF
jgi:hypothetical protein